MCLKIERQNKDREMVPGILKNAIRVHMNFSNMKKENSPEGMMCCHSPHHSTQHY